MKAAPLRAIRRFRGRVQRRPGGHGWRARGGRRGRTRWRSAARKPGPAPRPRPRAAPPRAAPAGWHERPAAGSGSPPAPWRCGAIASERLRVRKARLLRSSGSYCERRRGPRLGLARVNPVAPQARRSAPRVDHATIPKGDTRNRGFRRLRILWMSQNPVLRQRSFGETPSTLGEGEGNMPRPAPTDLGIVLTFLRTGQGWSQSELGDAAGVAPTLINDYERGRKPLNRARLERLADALGLPPAAIDETLRLLEANRAAGGAPQDADDPSAPSRRRIGGVA